jgi:abortive infection bacteriophage resistance protein
LDRSDETFIQHIKNSYVEPLPPVWAAAEVMSLGLLSSWYDNLKPYATRVAISGAYQLDDSVLTSWLRHLTNVRNICAHHGRLWNRKFVVTPQLPRTKPAGLGLQFIPGSRKIYNTAVRTLYLMSLIAPDSHWSQRLRAIVESGSLDPATMDFPKDWQSRPIWNDGAKP